MNFFLHKNTTILVLAPIIVVASITFGFWFKFEKNITGFFLIGETFKKSPFLDENEILIVKNEVGYDGQQFLSLAFDPLMQHEGTLEALDNPRYRAKRILLPLVSNFLSLGEYKLIPYVFVVLNSIGILAIFFLFYSIQKNKNSFYLLSLAIPGIWIVLRISTAEIIANTLILTSYFFIQHKKDKTSFLFLMLACLTKETMIIFPVSYGLDFLIKKDFKKIFVLAFFFIPFYIWHIYLIYKFGLGGDFDEFRNFTSPFYGVFKKWSDLIFLENNKHEYLYFILLNISIILLITKLKYIYLNHIYLFGSSLVYITLFALSSSAIYDYHFSYNRVFIPVFIILLLSFKDNISIFDKVFWFFSTLSSIRIIYWVMK